MCIICIDLLKHKMTLGEAKRAANEMNYTISGSDHILELEEAIDNMDLEKLGKVLEEGLE